VNHVPVGEIGLNYATALMESLRSPDEVGRAAADLRAFRDLMHDLPSLRRVLEHPGWSPEQRRKILDEVFDKADFQPTTRRFLAIVVEKRRIREFPRMEEAFRRLRDARENVTEAEVVSAVPVDEAAKAQWEEALRRLTDKKVRVRYRTDSSLIGGALTRVGSVVYDGSVRKQLERIRGVLLDESMETRS